MPPLPHCVMIAVKQFVATVGPTPSACLINRRDDKSQSVGTGNGGGQRRGGGGGHHRPAIDYTPASHR